MFEQTLTLPIIIFAALLDSINPCVFGVLIFLLAFLMTVFKSANRMLIAGIVYVFFVYITYFLLGFGIFLAVVGTGITKAVYILAALIAILAGLVEIKDFFWYGKGFQLKILPSSAERIKKYIKYIEKLDKKNPWLSYAMAGLLGMFVPLVELPCTGAPYFAILALLSKGSYTTALPALLLYNFIFILPLIVIIGILYFGKSSDRIEIWRKKHRRLMRLAVGLFLLALGAYMIYNIAVL